MSLCPKCNQHFSPKTKHLCPSFECRNIKNEEIATIYAVDSAAAAAKFVEEDDEYDSAFTVADGETMQVQVTDSAGETTLWSVTGEFQAVYYTEQVHAAEEVANG